MSFCTNGQVSFCAERRTMKKCKKVVDKQSPPGVPCEHRQGKQPGRKKFKKNQKRC
nr:MAG TPA: hypothetical protein [Caudoviricetes sp.]